MKPIVNPHNIYNVYAGLIYSDDMKWRTSIYGLFSFFMLFLYEENYFQKSLYNI